MDQSTREQVRLILEDADDLARKAVQEHIQAVITNQNKRGMLNSSMTVGAALVVLEEDGRLLIKECVDRVSALAMDVEAYAMISETARGFLQFLSVKYDAVSSRGLGGRGSQARAPHFAAKSSELWGEASSRLERQLELHRFVFNEPQTANTAFSESSNRLEPGIARRNKGGKILAKHWDQMWADIAVQLWLGDLKPESQADIKRAMFAWFAQHEIEIGDTAVNDRARALWLRYEAAE